MVNLIQWDLLRASNDLQKGSVYGFLYREWLINSRCIAYLTLSRMVKSPKSLWFIALQDAKTNADFAFHSVQSIENKFWLIIPQRAESKNRLCFCAMQCADPKNKFCFCIPQRADQENKLRFWTLHTVKSRKQVLFSGSARCGIQKTSFVFEVCTLRNPENKSWFCTLQRAECKKRRLKGCQIMKAIECIFRE